jgi:hypothetical protein
MYCFIMFIWPFAATSYVFKDFGSSFSAESFFGSPRILKILEILSRKLVLTEAYSLTMKFASVADAVVSLWS